MSIIRAPRQPNGFTVIRDDVLRDERLSYRARGILAVILSRPDNWRTDAISLCRGATEGREAVRSALRELEEAGYIVRQRLQDERGRWRSVALVHEVPQPTQETLPMASNQDGFPTPGNPASGKPEVGGLGAISSTEKENLEGTTPTAANGDGSPSIQDWSTAATRLVMEHRGEHLLDARSVNAVAKRYRTLAGVQAATPEQFAQAYLACRQQGITKPNAERVHDALARRVRLADTHDAHWASGAGFQMD